MAAPTTVKHPFFLPRELWLLILDPLTISNQAKFRRLGRYGRNFWSREQWRDRCDLYLKGLGLDISFVARLLQAGILIRPYQAMAPITQEEAGKFRTFISHTPVAEKVLLRNIYNRFCFPGREALLAQIYDAARVDDRGRCLHLVSRDRSNKAMFSSSLSIASDDALSYLMTRFLEEVSLKVVRDGGIACYRRYLTFHPKKEETMRWGEFDRIIYANAAGILRNLLDFPPTVYAHFYPNIINHPSFPSSFRKECCSIKCLLSEKKASGEIRRLLAQRGYSETFLPSFQHYVYLAPDSSID
jgi:hypothetical protein